MESRSGFTGPPAPRELLVVRHAVSHYNDSGVIAGPSCRGLTPLGVEQARALGDRLAAEGGVTAVHASTTRRAAQTAQAVAERLGLPVRQWEALRVPDPGSAEGMRWSDARDDFATDPRNPARSAAPGAESWQAYLDRACGALTEILDHHHEGRLLVVGHSETVVATWLLLLGAASLGRLRISVGHTAVNAWRTVPEHRGVAVDRQRWTVIAHNDAGHLRPTEGADRDRRQ
jgi:probable phosphoglycerate mutase